MSNAAKKQEVKPLENMSVAEIHAAREANSGEVVASDVLIPRLLLMQGISPLVTSRKAQIGDIVRSTTGEKVGNPDKSVDIIPLKMVNSWINFEDTGQGQPAFRGMEHRGKDHNGQTNEDLPWEYKGEEGQDMFRRKAITLYALIPADVEAYNREIERAVAVGEAPDLNKTLLPVVLTFQSTSFKYAGKKCASFFNDVRTNAIKLQGRMTIAPFQYVLTLKCREEKKGTNAWYVYDFEAPKMLKDAAIRAEAAKWAQVLAAGNVKTDDSGEIDEDATSRRGGSTTEVDV